MADDIKQFKRVCRLIVGKDGSGIEVKDLRIKFDVKKTSDGEANTAHIEVYNLSPEHQSQIIQEWSDIKLMAGYTGEERLIFQGQIRTALPVVDGTDRIVTIEAGDGDREIMRGFINKTLKAGATADDIVSECKKSMFDIGTTHADTLNATYARGKVLSGRASDILDQQARNEDAQWSIQDGQMLLLKGDNVRPNAVWLISQETGMLGSPEPTTVGLKVRTLLNPAFIIGGVAKIESLVFSGGVRIESINHKGDTHDSEWVSELEGLSV
ncbi:phage protein [Psychrobacter sp. AOP7-A1-24]|uniref:phage protein n=1 Tax=Psychrobacter sp. AOP7-A1-24 TaxID=3457646 RepID=UPI00402B8A1C